jgi:hypothetical protein
MEWMNVQKAAKKLGFSAVYLRKLARMGRVQGAQKLGRDWLIPSPPRVLPSERPRGYHGHRKNLLSAGHFQP